MRNEHFSTISSVVSAICALIAVVSAIWIHLNSTKEERLNNRAIIGLVDTPTKVSTELNGDIHIEHIFTLKIMAEVLQKMLGFVSIVLLF